VLDFGGVESIFVLQSKLIDRQAFDFRVCTFWKKGDAAREVEAAGIPVDDLGVDPSIRNPRATLALARYLRRTRPDVLHASIGEANFHAALVSKLCGVPATIIEEQGLPTRARFGRWVHAGLYRGVDAIVGVSGTTCDYLTEQEHAPRRRVHKIYNCARPDFFVPRPVREARGPFTALVVGRLVEVKNHERLLRAFARVLKQHPQTRLQLAGDGPLRDKMQQLVNELGLSSNVELLGFRSDVLELLQAADVFVLPSLSEGCSLALAEAMASGTPVIGSNVGGIPEVMQDVGREWLVPATDVDAWADALCRMIELSEEQRRQLGARAAEVAQRFSPSTNIAALQSLYTDLLREAS
jgi:glycosyltransferase involved in cell wall biosynthesis